MSDDSNAYLKDFFKIVAKQVNEKKDVPIEDVVEPVEDITEKKDVEPVQPLATFFEMISKEYNDEKTQKIIDSKPSIEDFFDMLKTVNKSPKTKKDDVVEAVVEVPMTLEVIEEKITPQELIVEEENTTNINTLIQPELGGTTKNDPKVLKKDLDKYATHEDLQNYYNKFLSKIQQQLSASSGGGGGPVKKPSGVVILDFGQTKNKSMELFVPTVRSIKKSEIVNCYMRIEETEDHSEDEMAIDPIRVVVKSIEAGLGFTIFGEMENARTHGKYKVQWYFV